jgi:hypothetical protein
MKTLRFTGTPSAQSLVPSTGSHGWVVRSMDGFGAWAGALQRLIRLALALGQGFWVAGADPASVLSRADPILVGGYALERVVIPSRADISGEPQSIQSSCECAQVLAYAPMPGGRVGWEVLLRVKPEREGVFSYDISAAFPAGGRIVSTLHVEARLAGAGGVAPNSLGSPMAIASEIEAGAIIFDVRPMERFSRAHVPGAIPIARHELGRALRQARGRAVIVGDGHDDAELMADIMSARRGTSAQVQVLAGGARGWRARRGSMEGSAPGGTDMLVLRAGEVLAWMGDPRVAWVASAGFQGPSNSITARRMGTGLVLPSVEAGRSPDPWGRIRQLGTTQPRPRFVVMAVKEAAEAEALLVRALAVFPDLPVFAVQGGEAALEAEAALVLRMQSKTTVTREGGHGQDPVRASGRRSGGGCCGK